MILSERDNHTGDKHSLLIRYVRHYLAFYFISNSFWNFPHMANPTGNSG